MVGRNGAAVKALAEITRQGGSMQGIHDARRSLVATMSAESIPRKLRLGESAVLLAICISRIVN